MKYPHPYRPELLKPFRREALALWNLRHPSLPTLEACYGNEDGCVTLVMPYIEGTNLWCLLRDAQAAKKEALPMNDVCMILLKVLEALDHLHARGFVHRDVKPGNILYNPGTRHVTLIDLGSCTNDPEGDLIPGTCEGTAGYISPEVLGGEPSLPVADLYGLGITAAGLVGMQLDTRVFHEPRLEETRHVHPAFRLLIDALTRKDPGLRPQTAFAAATLVAQAQMDMAADPEALPF